MRALAFKRKMCSHVYVFCFTRSLEKHKLAAAMMSPNLLCVRQQRQGSDLNHCNNIRTAETNAPVVKRLWAGRHVGRAAAMLMHADM